MTDFYGSRVNSKEIRGNLWIQRLLPVGVYDAAWMELGMLSKSLCKKVGGDEIVLDRCDSEECSADVDARDPAAFAKQRDQLCRYLAVYHDYQLRILPLAVVVHHGLSHRKPGAIYDRCDIS